LLAGRIVHPQASVITLGYGGGRHTTAVFRLAALLRRLDADVLHTHGWGSRSLLGFAAAKLARVSRCVNGEHGVLHLDKAHRLALQRFMAPRFDGTLSVSEALKQKLVSRLNVAPRHITVIPNGVDTSRFNGAYPRVLKRQELGLPAEAQVVAVIGSLKKEKNQQVALDAVAVMAGEGRPVSLLLVGDGADRGLLEAQARNLGVTPYVRFLGNRADVAELLPAIDVVALCSVPDHEGMSNTLLEAMASGVPVVTSDSVGAREVVDDGRTGLLFDYRDPRDLASKLRWLLDDDVRRQTIVENARRVVRLSFSIGAMVGRYQDYYSGLFDGQT
jgi:glycosyltransferase involved in cell wall biosynthesis